MINHSDTNITIISFYSFVNIAAPEILMQKLLLFAKKKYLRGTILVAKEGFNGSISGSDENATAIIAELERLTNTLNIIFKKNFAKAHPFSKLKVKLKPEIITMGVGSLDIDHFRGEYIETKDWDEFISREDVIVVDTRNDYEVAAGTFQGAVNPKTETFRQLPDWIASNKELLAGKKIAMCCTGGVRCEKSTAYMKKLGYEDVYHLKGGILQYLEDTKNQSQKWQGECFVFDDRRAVDDDLAPSEKI